MTAQIIPFPARARRVDMEDLDRVLACEPAARVLDELLAEADDVYRLLLAGWLDEAGIAIDTMHARRGLAAECPPDVRAALMNQRDEIVGNLRADFTAFEIRAALPAAPEGVA